MTQSIRGMQDIYGLQLEKFLFILESARKLASCYGFFELQTPVLESSSLFERNLGQESDILKKEIYKFQDRGGIEIALRPEFTAGVVRSLIENNFTLPARIFSCGQLFRYDRPQKGRYRQFNQVNFEIFSSGGVGEDIDCILLAYNFLCALGLHEKFSLEINTLGSKETLQKYNQELYRYFSDKSLSEVSAQRLKKNPLRILDSNEPEDREICFNAPEITQYYHQKEKEAFETFLHILNDLNVPYKVNPRIVRGIDYYTGLVFEFVTDLLGAQSTILGGGRYDKLVFEIGGKDTPAVGFAAGVERLCLLSETKVDLKKALFILPLKDENLSFAFLLAEQCRKENIIVFIVAEGSVTKRLGRVSKELFHSFALVVGKREESESIFLLKDLKESSEGEGDIQYIISCLK